MALPVIAQKGLLSQGGVGQSLVGGVPGLSALGSNPAQSVIQQAIIGANRSQQ